MRGYPIVPPPPSTSPTRDCPACPTEHALSGSPPLDRVTVHCAHGGSAEFDLDVLADAMNAWEPAPPD